MTIRLFILSALLPFFIHASDLKPGTEKAISADIILTQEGTAAGKELKFQPVFPVQISSTIVNKGPAASKPMKLQVRYAYPQPYQNSPDSILFETEAVDIPALQSGEESKIQFAKSQPLPTISDFVLNDWPMRQYQAVVVADGKEEIVGTLALTYSAYYYPIKARD